MTKTYYRCSIVSVTNNLHCHRTWAFDSSNVLAALDSYVERIRSQVGAKPRFVLQFLTRTGIYTWNRTELCEYKYCSDRNSYLE